MGETDVLPAPQLDPRNGRNDALSDERQAFYQMHPELLRQYPDRYVAVYKRQVVASGVDVAQVAADAYSRCGYVPIYVNLVAEEPQRPVRVPSPRRLPHREPQ